MDIEYQEGTIVSKTLIKKQSGTVTLFAFDKDQELSEHTAPFDALVQVVEGSMDITIDGTVRTVSAGELLLMPAKRPHALKATQPAKMILTMIRDMPV